MILFERAGRWRFCWALLASAAMWGCGTPASYRQDADTAAYSIVEQKQAEALGRTEPFTVEPAADTLRRRLLLGKELPRTGPASLSSEYLETPDKWPGPTQEPQEAGVPEGDGRRQADGSVVLSLIDSLQVAARNSREYQTQKEGVFRSALALDLERDEFRNSFAGILSGGVSTDGRSSPSTTGTETSGEASVTRLFRSGVSFTTNVALDLVKLLTGDKSSSLGILADATLTIPLLRGAGKEVVAEPLTQAERDVLYAIWEFERFKRVFAVRVTTEYLQVLREVDQVRNAEENYRGLISSARRARRLADSGRLPEIQVDQVIQDGLRARSRWIRAQESYARQLDTFKLTIGLPTDAPIGLERAELESLAEVYQIFLTDFVREALEEIPPADAPITLRPPDPDNVGPLEIGEAAAIRLALRNRLDLRVDLGLVYDAQRQVVVAADALRAGLDLVAAAEAGERRTVASAGLDDARLDFGEGRYSALLTLDLPWERTAERNVFRETYIALEASLRDLQESEDRVKFEVRDRLRDLLEFREEIQIQAQAMDLADRRVNSTNLFLQAGRAEIRDLLEARESLLDAQNALTAAMIGYRLAELGLQRDLGLLRVDEQGLLREYRPGEESPAEDPAREGADGDF